MTLHRIAAALAALLFALAPAAWPAPATVTIDISKFAFNPKEITVAPGTRIIWTNRDDTPHTVSSRDKIFASKALDTDDKYEYTFATPGDFNYYCVVHPYMTGAVHVRKP
ncbi:cupredoxin family copper-binding protein [Chromobacterium subtsugae]|uniref:Cupredoxin family copper-binding protein n=1 Tax=Chromobacterium subtsugae TaxID=251747 RepID=A0ABS7FBT9_9NEIS|nr:MULTISPECIES: cupredoxin family copper-binding protein [Chromobacterium]KUM03023.1 amicyanin [Chromobacterium subtsugae]KZE85982.1 amicyanin [Chromobacterium sp. F49]MBW7567356.1 cupredoxin family copper-binding protein [Chromobacterium subtsugae]MBW8287522.1 cupredoxin family copper-binding protein [Chromobacterium subtsugae]WSE93477.1 cupredoxin family copper-binding protein [Chromobacterium subtsugae]